MCSFGRRIAGEVIQRYGTRDMNELCACLGISLHEVPLRRLVGFVDHDDSGTFIIVNRSLPVFVKRFVVAHEVGHYVIHPRDVGFFWIMEKTHFYLARLEKHADDFACELLEISEHDYDKAKEYIRAYGREPAFV